MQADSFQRFFGLLPEPSLLLTPSGKILAGNRAVYDLLAYAPGTHLPGTALHDIVADAAAKVDRFLQLCRRTNRLTPGALNCKTASNTEVRCRVEGALLPAADDPGGNSLLLRVFPREAARSRFGVLNDRIDALNREIAGRQRTEARLHAEREWLRTTLASIGDAVIATDSEGRISFMNAVAESLTGWSQSEAVGQPLDGIFAIIDEETREAVDNPVFAVLRQGGIVALANHTLLVSKNGLERPIADSGAPIRDQSGEILGVVLVFRDVTDSQRAQSLVAQSEKRYRRIFDTARVGIWEQDFSKVRKDLLALQKQGITNLRSYLEEHPEFVQNAVRQIGTRDVNPAAVEILEADSKQELLQSLHKIFVRETYEVFAEELLTVITGNSTFQAETSLVSLRGRKMQVVFTVTFPPDDVAMTHVLVSFMDVTPQKEAERALRSANEALARANTDLEYFAYAAAHDLQEPLRNVMLYTQLLERRYANVLDEKGRRACRITIDGAHRMQALVKGLLDYNRVVSEADTDEEIEATVPMDCRRVISSVKENLRTSIKEAHAEILYGELPFVNARDTHLIQLFQNLLSNAIKYRKPGTDAVVHITAREEGDKWVFLVQDNGVGVPTAYQGKIFQAFKRLHGREIPGAGMGLTICSRIVGLYGGKMWVESEEGRGSTFAFTLPRHKGTGDAD